MYCPLYNCCEQLLIMLSSCYAQAIETDMVEQVQRFDELNECGQQIVQYVDNEQTVQQISSQLEGFQERWEKLVRQMELQSKQVNRAASPRESHCQ